jgi:phosphomevalonate kinase
MKSDNLEMPQATTVVSCPGKVLMAGGYLVLEPENGGLVVGTASRFYTVVKNIQDSAKASSSSASPSQYRITVNSPQFIEATWTYEVRVEAKGNGCTVQQVQDG